MSSFWDRPGGHNQYIAAVLASLSVFNFGVTIGWSAPSVFAVTEKKYYGFAVSLTEYGWACAMANLGCSLTMVPAAALANCIGRKLIMLLVVLPYIAGWVLTFYPFNMYLLMFSRLLQGLCAGCYLIIASVYCVEISQVEVKSYIGNFPLIFYYLGILYAYILGAFNNMRYLNYGCAVTPAVFLLTFVWMPESPVYYMLKNKKMKAIGSLQWLRGKHMDAAREYDDIMGAIERLRDNNKFSCQKLRRLASAKAIIICTIMVAFKNLCGSIAIIMYSTLMLDAADSQIFMDSKVSIIFIGISVLISTLISVHKFDSRRTLMIWSIIMVALNCALQSIYFQMKDSYVHSLQWLPIVSFCCFSFFFGLGVGIYPFVMMRQLFGENIEILAASVVWTLNELFAFCGAVSFPYILHVWNMAVCFWIFTALAFLCLIFIYFLVPETKKIADSKEMLDEKQNTVTK